MLSTGAERGGVAVVPSIPIEDPRDSVVNGFREVLVLRHINGSRCRS